MASSNLVRLVVGGGGGSLAAAWGVGVLFVEAFDSLGGGLYPTDASYTIQGVLPPHLRSLKQGMEKLRQGLKEFNHTLLEVEEALEAEAEAQAQAEEEDSSQDGRKGPAAILSMGEVCRELGMSKSWVYNRVRSGQIRSIKLGGAIKIKRADLDEYIEKQPYQSFD